MTRLKTHFFPIAILVCSIICWLGIVDKADNVTHRVLDLVAALDWSATVGPFYMPFPIDAQAFRPLSVLGLKTYAEWFGTGPPPSSLVAIKTFVSLLLFCLASRTWLQAIGLSRHAELASLLPLGLAPVLFQAWYLPELDLFGAAGTLWIGAALLERGVLSPRRWAVILLSLLAVLTLKESTALIQLCFLGATTCLLYLQGFRDRRVRRHVCLTIGSALVWGAMVVPLLRGGEASSASQASLLTRLSIVEHNMVQVLYLGSAVCALLVFLGSLQMLSNDRSRLAQFGPPLALLALLFTPPMVYYSHYEAVYFAPRILGVGFASLLFLGLLLFTLNSLRERALSMAAGQVLFVFGAMSFTALLAPNAREDMASRIFVALAPALFALALSSADLLKAPLRVLPPSLGRTASRFSTAALVAGTLYYPMAHAWNYSADWQARHAVDLPGKQRIAEVEWGDLFLFNHYVEWLDPLGLIAAGAPETVRDWEFLHMPAWLPRENYENANWIYPGRFSLEEALENRQVHIYWMTPRSSASESYRNQRLADLSWTRKDLGLFSPIAPDLHNRPEDHLMTIYREGPSPLEDLMEQGQTIWSMERRFVLVSPTLFELPRQLLQGIQPFEFLRYDARLIELPSPRLFPELKQ
ncbi:MAG: hypothetical protein VXW32_00860 [Myxococcota bacterium]|nr:hypothetical protein [Myxococcota bacterium]